MSTRLFHPGLQTLVFAGIATLQAIFPHPLKAQPYGAIDPVMGIYEGKWSAQDQHGTVKAQIRPLGDSKYDGFIMIQSHGSNVTVLNLTGTSGGADAPLTMTASTITAKTDEVLSKASFKGEISLQRTAANKLTGKLSGDLGEGELDAVRVTKKSPTLGAKAPANAIVMFDGKTTNQWEDFHFLLNEDGSMQVQKGTMNSKPKLDNFKLHVEFRTPFMPQAQGQARGNSGVYLQSIYEVQVLDSFGLYPLQINDCGSVYGIQRAKGNECYPPMEWQTYDIEYHQHDNTAQNPPEITIVHNGIPVIEKARVPEKLLGIGGGGGNPKGGFTMLQDHGNPVQFRNIWVQPLSQ
ncbi:MAG: hypothetical protein JWN25_1194 [Verrucomicrobiales bacterium]|nr:hypothetical protein [Verrucomicrobiales bacterium]